MSHDGWLPLSRNGFTNPLSNLRKTTRISSNSGPRVVDSYVQINNTFSDGDLPMIANALSTNQRMQRNIEAGVDSFIASKLSKINVVELVEDVGNGNVCLTAFPSLRHSSGDEPITLLDRCTYDALAQEWETKLFFHDSNNRLLSTLLELEDGKEITAADDELGLVITAFPQEHIAKLIGSMWTQN